MVRPEGMCQYNKVWYDTTQASFGKVSGGTARKRAGLGWAYKI